VGITRLYTVFFFRCTISQRICYMYVYLLLCCVAPVRTGHRYARPSEEVSRTRTRRTSLPLSSRLFWTTLKINPSDIGDTVVGTVLGPGSQRANVCRMAAFYAGEGSKLATRGVNGSRLKFFSKSIRRPISQKSPQGLEPRMRE